MTSQKIAKQDITGRTCPDCGGPIYLSAYIGPSMYYCEDCFRLWTQAQLDDDPDPAPEPVPA